MSERSRLISEIRIGPDNKTFIARTVSPDERPLDLTEGTFWPLGDGSPQDIYKNITDALTAEFGDPFTLEIYGVNLDGLPAVADGRLRTGGAITTKVIVPSYAGWTMDRGIWGIANDDLQFTASGNRDTPYRHRFGYYPHVFASERFQLPIDDRGVFFSTGGYPDSRALQAYEELNLTYRDVPACFVRPEAAILPDWLAESFGLTLGDPYATWARFWFDVTDGADDLLSEPRNPPPNQAIRSVRFYPDATKTTYSGPWVLHPNSPIWSRPLDPPSRPEGAAGETWSLVSSMRSHPATGLD